MFSRKIILGGFLVAATGCSADSTEPTLTFEGPTSGLYMPSYELQIEEVPENELYLVFEGRDAGKFYVKDGELQFEGNPSDSAKVFLDILKQHWKDCAKP